VGKKSYTKAHTVHGLHTNKVTADSKSNNNA